MENLKDILSRGESVHLEAKSGKGGFPDSLWETYSAFANTDGGTILLGVEEDHNHKLFVKNGLSDARKMKDIFWNLVNNRQKISHNIVLEKNVYVAQSKSKDGFVFANPGNMRISQSEAIAGGVSDPRNATLLKMFSLIRFGERAGSGLNGIMQVWSKVYHTMPVITEKTDADRVILTLSTNGNEPDMEAMLEFYDDEMLLEGDELATSIGTGDKIGDKSATNFKTGDKTSEKSAINADANKIIGDKSAINKAKIVEYITLHPNAKSRDIASYINLGISRTKDYLAQLADEGVVAASGANKNRTYSVVIKNGNQ